MVKFIIITFHCESNFYLSTLKRSEEYKYLVHVRGVQMEDFPEVGHPIQNCNGSLLFVAPSSELGSVVICWDSGINVQHTDDEDYSNTRQNLILIPIVNA